MNAENKKEKSRIMVIDDHAVVRDGLVALINRVPDLKVCCEADSKAAAAKILLTDQPDLVIIDLMLSDGDGLDLIKDMRVQLPNLPFLVISMQDEKSQIQNRAAAMRVLQTRLLLLKREEEAAKKKELAGTITASWGDQIRSYFLYGQQLVKDLRTNYEVSRPEAVFDGDLDGFIFAYLKAASRGELQDA